MKFETEGHLSCKDNKCDCNGAHPGMTAQCCHHPYVCTQIVIPKNSIASAGRCPLLVVFQNADTAYNPCFLCVLPKYGSDGTQLRQKDWQTIIRYIFKIDHALLALHYISHLLGSTVNCTNKLWQGLKSFTRDHVWSYKRCVSK